MHVASCKTVKIDILSCTWDTGWVGTSSVKPEPKSISFWIDRGCFCQGQCPLALASSSKKTGLVGCLHLDKIMCRSLRWYIYTLFFLTPGITKSIQENRCNGLPPSSMIHSWFFFLFDLLSSSRVGSNPIWRTNSFIQSRWYPWLGH